MGQNNIIRIVLSLAIIVGFFMPFFSVGYDLELGASISGWTMMFETIKNISHISELPSAILIMTACLVIIFISAILVFINSLLQRGVSSLLRILPFLAILVFLIYLMTQGTKVSDLFKSFAIGFYLIAIGSLLLAFFGSTARRVATA